MERRRLKFEWAAAVLALASCGESGSNPAAPQPGDTGGVTIELPEPKAPPAPAAVPEAPKAEAGPEEAKPKVTPPPVAIAPPKAPEPEAPKVETPAPEASPKSEAPPANDAASPLPLPRAVVARTIERIGYPCGAVASSARIEAPAGETAYRITCTSGDSYRASDRSGRFRFRKVE